MQQKKSCLPHSFSLLEASRAGADILQADGESFRYPSYVEDIMVEYQPLRHHERTAAHLFRVTFFL